jgi:hypothetical protein
MISLKNALGLFQFGWASWKTDALIPVEVARLSLPSDLTLKNGLPCDSARLKRSVN